MISTFIFDLGGVVLFQENVAMGTFVSKIFNIPFEKAETLYSKDRYKLVKGEITSKQLLLKFKSELHSSLSIGEMKKMWKDLYIHTVEGINQELMNEVRILRKTYKVYLFTNTIDVHAAYFDTLKMNRYFDGIMKSFEEGVMKPEKDAYERMISVSKVPPEEIMFIDDLEKNVEGARASGMNGIVFKNNEQLMQELERIGIERLRR